MYCPSKDEGCEWQGEVNAITGHLNNNKDVCQFQEVNCPIECGKTNQRRYLSNHVETECPRHKVNCQYCHDTGEHQFIEGQHKEECPKYPLPCPNNCGVGNIPSDELAEHFIKCSLEEIKCEYHVVGCVVMMACKDQKRTQQENGGGIPVTFSI